MKPQFRNTRTYGTALLSSLLVLSMHANLAQSQSDDAPLDVACARYVEESVRQQAANVQLGAGLKPPAWSADRGAHMAWCLRGDNRRSTPSALAERERALQKHVLATSGDACRRYAAESVRQQRDNRQLGSGFPPPVWSDDLKSHENWCKQANEAQSTPAHLADRAFKLQAYVLAHSQLPSSPIDTTGENAGSAAAAGGLATIHGAKAGGPSAPVASGQPGGYSALATFPDHCYQGQGRCLWVIPAATRESTFAFEYQDVEGRLDITVQTVIADLAFAGQSNAPAYACAYLRSDQNTQQAAPETVTSKTAKASQAVVKVAGSTLPVLSRGQCLLSDDVPYDQLDRLVNQGVSWHGSIVIVSREPMMIDAYKVNSQIRNTVDPALGTPRWAQMPKAFVSGESERAVTAYAVDCRKPRGYEGLCAYARGLLGRMN
jgi:hypothetical protein